MNDWLRTAMLTQESLQPRQEGRVFVKPGPATYLGALLGSLYAGRYMSQQQAEEEQRRRQQEQEQKSKDMRKEMALALLPIVNDPTRQYDERMRAFRQLSAIGVPAAEPVMSPQEQALLPFQKQIPPPQKPMPPGYTRMTTPAAPLFPTPQYDIQKMQAEISRQPYGIVAQAASEFGYAPPLPWIQAGERLRQEESKKQAYLQDARFPETDKELVRSGLTDVDSMVNTYLNRLPVEEAKKQRSEIDRIYLDVQKEHEPEILTGEGGTAATAKDIAAYITKFDDVTSRVRYDILNNPQTPSQAALAVAEQWTQERDRQRSRLTSRLNEQQQLEIAERGDVKLAYSQYKDLMAQFRKAETPTEQQDIIQAMQDHVTLYGRDWYVPKDLTRTPITPKGALELLDMAYQPISDDADIRAVFSDERKLSQWAAARGIHTMDELDKALRGVWRTYSENIRNKAIERGTDVRDQNLQRAAVRDAWQTIDKALDISKKSGGVPVPLGRRGHGLLPPVPPPNFRTVQARPMSPSRMTQPESRKAPASIMQKYVEAGYMWPPPKEYQKQWTYTETEMDKALAARSPTHRKLLADRKAQIERSKGIYAGLDAKAKAGATEQEAKEWLKSLKVRELQKWIGLYRRALGMYNLYPETRGIK